MRGSPASITKIGRYNAVSSGSERFGADLKQFAAMRFISGEMPKSVSKSAVLQSGEFGK
jgi:hypothetical protein